MPLISAAHVYTKYANELVHKLDNLAADALKVMLLSAYVPDRDNHEFVHDVLLAGTEEVGAGYTRLTATGVVVSTTGHVVEATCNNIAWTGATIGSAFAVFYDGTPGTDATNPVICYWDFGGVQHDTAGSFVLSVAPSGLLTMTVA